MMKTAFLFCLVLCATAAFGQFGEQNIIVACTVCSPQQIQSGDLNGDDFPDILTASFDDDKIAWFENDGTGQFSQQHIISTQSDGASATHAADLDGDGDLDVLAASLNGNKITWFRNDRNGNFSDEIYLSFVRGASFVSTADLDRDGDLDVLSIGRNDLIVAWHRNDGVGNFSERITISQTVFTTKVYPVDIDGDGILDLLLDRDFNAGAHWKKNDGNGNFSDRIILNQEISAQVSILYPYDVDKDGDPDIIALIKGKIGWYQNIGNGNFANVVIMYDNPHDTNSIYVSDMDNDGDIDFTTTGATKITWYRNDGLLGYSAHILADQVTGGVFISHSIDLNKDSLTDIIYGITILDKIGWYKNVSPDSTFIEYNISDTEANGIRSLHVADLDGDAKPDVLSASRYDNKIAWYKNEIKTHQRFSEQRIISDEILEATAVASADLDKDGDEDVVFASFRSGRTYWCKNDGIGNFSQPIEIAGQYDAPTAVYVMDVDKDNDWDVLTGSIFSSQIILSKNNGNGTFAAPVYISILLTGTESFHSADFNQDGHLDILVASTGYIRWLPNDGNGNFSFPIEVVVLSNGYKAAYAVDINGDGAVDVLAAAEAANKIVWFENDGSGRFSREILIASKIFGANTVSAIDVDIDGDLDVVAASFKDDKIGWFENDGLGNFSSLHLISKEAKAPNSVLITDVDQDGHPDVVSRSFDDDKIAWYKNLSGESTISTLAFWDANTNATLDSTERTIKNLPINLSPQALSYYRTLEGGFRFFVENGQYTLFAQADSCWQLTTDSLNYTVHISNREAVERNFGFLVASDYQHTQVRVNADPTRCGFFVSVWASVENDGCVPSQGKMGLILDSLVTFVQSATPPDQIIGDTLFWNYEQLLSSEIKQIRLILRVAGVDFIGDTIHLKGISYVETAGILQLSSTYEFTSVISCAYDPNDKLVLPNRTDIYDQNYTLFSESLEYTIRFQNTGNGTAFTVILRDTLSTDLDWNTFKPITASHSYEIKRYPNGLVEFIFNDILLPNSTVDEPGSHGFVMFKISPIAGLPENTAVNNTADIYFDFNPPIRTNTTNNVFVSTLPKITHTKTVDRQLNITAFPNPFRNAIHFQLNDNILLNNYTIQLFDGQGRRLAMQKMTEGRCTIQNNNFPAGLYFYTLSDNQGNILTSGKLVCK